MSKWMGPIPEGMAFAWRQKVHIMRQYTRGVIRIPPGWGHFVENEQLCAKLAFDMCAAGSSSSPTMNLALLLLHSGVPCFMPFCSVPEFNFRVCAGCLILKATLSTAAGMSPTTSSCMSDHGGRSAPCTSGCKPPRRPAPQPAAWTTTCRSCTWWSARSGR